MNTATTSMDLRRVLDAPRGRRFNHTPPRPGPHVGTRSSMWATPEPLPPLVSLGRTPREREILAQMPDTPGLRRRLERGDLPEWMRAAAAQRAEEPDQTPKPDRTPGEDPRPDTSPSSPLPIPRPRREQVPPPQLPRRPDRPHRPASHRKPRRKIGPLLVGYALAALTGAVAQPLVVAFLS